MGEIEMTRLAVDMSPRGIRERAFARECARVAESEQRKAQRIRLRAGRLALGSNRRRRLLAESSRLEAHAGLMAAASQRPESA